MKLVFAHDHKLRLIDGKYYTVGGLRDSITDRYMEYFDSLTIFCRAIEKQPYDTQLFELKNPKIKVKPVSNGSLILSQSALRMMEEEIKNADALIVKLHSKIAEYAIKYARKYKIPYLVEVVGCPWDAYWNHSIKGKIVAPMMTLSTKKEVKRAPYAVYVTKEFLEKIRSKVDKIIVYIHWGKELEETSIDSQKKQAKILINSGVDLIIGSHPHVVEEIEYYDDVPVVYSLGDFIYGGTTKDTMVVSATFDYADNEYGDVYLKVNPGVSNYEKVVSDWEGTAKYTKYAALQNKCSTCFILKNGYVVSVNQFANIMDASSSNTYTFDEKKYKSEVLKNVFNNWSW